jgi:hypothetical protein
MGITGENRKECMECQQVEMRNSKWNARWSLMSILVFQMHHKHRRKIFAM